MIRTIEDARAKCKETQTIVIGKVMLTDGRENIVMVMPVVKQVGLDEEVGTIDILLSVDDAKDLGVNLLMATDAETTGWVDEEE